MTKLVSFVFWLCVLLGVTFIFEVNSETVVENESITKSKTLLKMFQEDTRNYLNNAIRKGDGRPKLSDEEATTLKVLHANLYPEEKISVWDVYSILANFHAKAYESHYGIFVTGTEVFYKVPDSNIETFRIIEVTDKSRVAYYVKECLT